MDKRKQRTPQEIIAETEAKLVRLQERAAKAEAKSNPAVAHLNEQLETVNKDIREARKGLGDGPQSFDARIQKHELWIEKIEEQRLDAQELLGLAEAQKTALTSEIASVISSLVSKENELSA